jgi:hypothetical protein
MTAIFFLGAMVVVSTVMMAEEKGFLGNVSQLSSAKAYCRKRVE